MQLCVAPLSPYSIWQAEYLSRHLWVHMSATMEAVPGSSPKRTVAKTGEALPPKKTAAKAAEVPPPKGSVAKAAVAPVVLKKPAVQEDEEEPEEEEPVVLKKLAGKDGKKATPKAKGKGKSKAKGKAKSTKNTNEDGFDIGVNGEELRDPVNAKKHGHVDGGPHAGRRQRVVREREETARQW